MPFQPSPIEVDPERIVQNVHPLPNPNGAPFAQPNADYDSRGHMETFLEGRLEDSTPPMIRGRGGQWRVFTPVERTRIGFNRWAYLPPVRDGLGWRRATLAGLFAINGILNLANGNIPKDVSNAVDDIAEEFSGAKDIIEDAWKLRGGEPCLEPGTHTTERTTVIHETERYFFSPNKVGESNPSLTVVDAVLDRIEAAQIDSTVTEIKLEWGAGTSDEWLGLGEAFNFGIGKPNIENADLGEVREAETKTLLQDRANERGIDIDGITVILDPVEHVLDEATRDRLMILAQSFGFEDIVDVIRTQNENPDSLPPKLATEFERHFPNNRDTEFKVDIKREQTRVITTESPTDMDNCVLIDGQPEDENHDYDFTPIPFLWPALPLFMRKRVTKMKGMLADVGDLQKPEHVLIHEDGINEQNILDKAAWAYVRKYMYLFREDDRISKIYEHGYIDEDGQKQSLKAIFVDHDPTPESLEMIGRIFQFAGQIQGGRLGRECDAVVVYPDANAGLDVDPEFVGLGIDVQYDGGVMGVALPTLGLIEMHMPPDPSDDERDQSYNSAAWTIAHELTGHFSDLNNQPNELTDIGQLANGKRLSLLPNRFANDGMTQYNQAAREEQLANSEVGSRLRQFVDRILRRRQPGGDAINWRVRSGFGTLPAEEVAIPVTQQINGVRDSILRRGALRIKKLTGNPTIYGSSLSHLNNPVIGASEAYAEASANMTTHIPIPFSEAPEVLARQIQSADPELWIDGFDASDGWNRVINNRWGSIQGGDNGERTIFQNEPQARNNWTHEYGVPENFAWARDLAAWARSVEIPEPIDPRWRDIVVDRRFKQVIQAERSHRSTKQ